MAETTPPHHEPDAGPDGFFKLPLELREMIYEMVYGDERSIRPIRRKDFNREEKDRKRRLRGEFVPTTFTESFFSPMIVSKQFCEEAARVWIRTKTFQLSSPRDFELTKRNMSSAESYLLVSITSITFSDLSSIGMELLLRLPKLARLHFRMRDYWFEFGPEDSPQNPLEHDYTDAELVKHSYMKAILKLRGIHHATFTWLTIHKAQNIEEADRFERFKAQVESLIRDVISQPREQTSTLTTAASLGEALRQKVSQAKVPIAPWTPHLPEPKSEVKALNDHEVPQTVGELVRACLTKPEAMLKWVLQAKKSK